LLSLDEKILFALNDLNGKYRSLDAIISWTVSDYLIPVCLCLALIYIWFIGHNKQTRYKYQLGVFSALAAMAISSGISQLISALIERPRPFLTHDLVVLFYKPTDFSFPSNSVAACFAIAAVVSTFNKKLGLLFFVLVGILAFSRVYVGVHYPSDVVMGAIIGILSIIPVYLLRKLMEPMPTCFIKVARIFRLA
jgi:undecaprenyl-diphosphatase|tara:strand:+ start:10873 stop:11454 length:582 start_codon:yes stop_codon:yes gene_type:complete